MSRVKIAAAQYPVGFLSSWDAYTDKVTGWVERAVAEQAELLVFPEYASMELASLFPETVYTSLSRQLSALQDLVADYLQLFSQLARRHRIYIQSGSFPVLSAQGEYRNRAYFFSPDGAFDYQEKLMMTRFENEQWQVKAGNKINLFPTRFGHVGIAVCYDSEFPMIVRNMVEQGALVILAPSCTDTRAGYHRVRIGCQARALENQCFVVQASLVGGAEWSEAIDINCGAAAVFSPVDKGFPDDGVLAEGEFDQEQWLFADLDLAKIAEVRNNGQVFNYRDWPKQFRTTEENA